MERITDEAPYDSIKSRMDLMQKVAIDVDRVSILLGILASRLYSRIAGISISSVDPASRPSSSA